MSKRRLYSEPLYKKAGATSPEYLEGKIVEPGWVLFVTAGSVEDETNTPTTIAFGKKLGDRYEPMEEENSPAAGIRTILEKTHVFIAGERPIFRFEGATASDILRAYLEGYYDQVC